VGRFAPEQFGAQHSEVDMALKIYEDILEYVRRMRPVVKAIEKHDPDLARQMKKALGSMALNGRR
jgi:hypothetical protein